MVTRTRETAKKGPPRTFLRRRVTTILLLLLRGRGTCATVWFNNSMAKKLCFPSSHLFDSSAFSSPWRRRRSPRRRMTPTRTRKCSPPPPPPRPSCDSVYGRTPSSASSAAERTRRGAGALLGGGARPRHRPSSDRWPPTPPIPNYHLRPPEKHLQEMSDWQSEVTSIDC